VPARGCRGPLDRAALRFAPLTRLLNQAFASQAGAYVILASAINRKADYLADLRETDVFSLKISHAAAGGDDSVADVRSNRGVQGDAPRAAAPDAGR
jgi:hypothetical protein